MDETKGSILKLWDRNSLLRRNANYRKLWLGNSGSILGDWFNQVALGQTTLALTHSPSALGLVLLCRSLPSVTLGPFISPLTDRYSKRAILLISDVARAVVVLIFPLAFIFQTVSLLYTGALLLGLSGIMFAPAWQAAFPLLVSKEDLPEANALSSGTYGFLSIIGALSGGIVSSLLNPVVCFIMNSMSYAWSAFCIYQIDLSENTPKSKERDTYLYSLRQGIKEVSHNKVARAIILIGISWGFAGGGYAILIPMLGDITFHMGGFGIGALYAIDGLGMLWGAFFVKKYIGNSDKRANLWYGMAYLTQALFFALLAQSTFFVFGAAMLLLMRLSSGIIVPLDNYLMQVHTKPGIRGRVFSLHLSTYSGVMQLSYASLGYLFERFGIPVMGVIIGMISFICGLSWLLQLKTLSDPDPRKSEESHF